MRVLLTGGSGYLGQHLLAHLRGEGHQLLAAYSSLASFPPDFASLCHRTFALDLADAAAVEEAVAQAQPDVVVHLAAISSPVACEDDPERAFAVNVPTALIDALPPSACVVFVSTDQVYDGLSPPYTEQSSTNPVNTYGRSKLAFEKACAEKLPERSVCLRSSLILGPRTPGSCRKQSFLQFCDEKLSLQETTAFIHDEYRSVVYVGDIVRIIHWFIDGGALQAPGVYNMGGPERVSRVDVARMVAERRSYPPERISQVDRASLQLGNTASPPDITMDSSKIAEVTGVKPTSLADMVASSLPCSP